MNEPANGSILVAHTAGARKITREELMEIPTPAGTRTHQPLSHYQIVEVLEEALSFRYLKVVRDEYAVSSDGMKMFGVMDLNLEFSGGCRFSIGLRNSNDKSMRLALTAGYRVFVCDNMAFSGDFTPLLHKHTRKLDLIDAISVAVDRIHRGFEPLKSQVQTMKESTLSEEEVKLIIYRAFLDRNIRGIPRHLMPIVHDLYFNPKHEAFTSRNLWSLSNAFTSAFKRLAPVKQFEATARLGTYLADAQAELQNKRELNLPIKGDERIWSIGAVSANSSINGNSRREGDFDEDDFDEDDIADDPFEDDFDVYYDEELAEEAIDEAMDEIQRQPLKRAA